MRTTFYLQAEPEWAPWKPDVLRAIKVRRITQKKPDSTIPGAVIVKLTLDIPDAAFKPLSPSAVVVIPNDMVFTDDDVTVEVENANAEA